MTIGQIIRRHRERLNMTQEELSAAISATPKAITKIENGSQGVSSQRLYALAKVFGIHPAELIDEVPFQEFTEIARALSDADRQIWLEVGRRLAKR